MVRGGGSSELSGQAGGRTASFRLGVRPWVARAPAKERRRQEQGPPAGLPERRAMRRRASDIPKTTCPVCGGQTSSVYETQRYGLKRSRGYERMRQCADCREEYPTLEQVDYEKWFRLLEKRGKSLEEIEAIRARVDAARQAGVLN